ncbi:hypothetical protein PPERSA_00997 [Pseudocohnilembus persalinus]|uniref:2'-phosphotransferase n=1 Tax=Pseudocohnilembus persalinus TaxID=266149 RepID=A0A0V0R8K4_PSEPJ|nr:hypothetical protein PPERSA_00997 [Pseudocohnilembus persalinus]|eukprot:KRX10827.1 hypothetical protein PPERSA_00997 [Pseudocohnilembus persalinus]
MEKVNRKYQPRIQDPSVKISKKLSYLLRHGAVKEDIPIGQDGYVLIDDILKRHDFKNVTLKQIIDVVENNDKKRFQIIDRVDEEKGYKGKYIRATQGHSIKTVNDEDLLEQVNDASKFPVVVHGTYKKFWEQIRKEGLKPMSRNHVHFAIGYPKDNEVISGMRQTCDVFVEIDLQRAIESDMKWYISNNKVLLSSGHNRVISPQYFKKVVDKNGNLLFEGIEQNWVKLGSNSNNNIKSDNGSVNNQDPGLIKSESQMSDFEEIKMTNEDINKGDEQQKY